MKNRWSQSVCLAMISLVLVGSANADDAKTEKAKKGPISVYAKTTGIIESAKMTPVKTDVKVWKTLKIETVVPQGTVVKEGDLILKFKSDEYQRALESAKLDYDSAVLDFEDTTLKLEQVEKAYRIDLEQAMRSFQQAKEDYEHYLKVEIPQRDEMQDYSLKSSEWSLENELEEYNQLKKMYEEDELTEESELIVLKRAKRSVDTAEMFLKRARINYKRNKTVMNPRADQLKKEAFEKVKIGHKKKLADLRAGLARAKIASQKAKAGLDKQKKSLAELEADGKKLQLHAPASGVVYYGKCNRGKWTSGAGTPNRNLKVDQALTAGQTVVTIVDVDKLQVRVAVDESLLGKLQVGSIGVAVANSDSSQRAKLTVSKLSTIPIAEGSFDCVAALAFDNSEMNLMPGMTCKVVFKTFEDGAALTVSKTSVFSDNEGLSHYVYAKDGESLTKRVVTVGVTSGDRIVIKSGLEEGREILKKKP